MRPRVLDLFCGGGGASMGYYLAGFDVVGVDREPQPDYPFPFVQADALAPPFRLEGFDLIHASPPCQAFTAYKRRPGHVGDSPDLVAATRTLLEGSGAPWVMENVPGAPMKDPITLCGSMFGLHVRRHRLFETSWEILMTPPCDHNSLPRRYVGASNRGLRRTVEVGVWRIPVDVQQSAMGIHWLTNPTLSQAIPPAYTEYIALEFLRSIETGVES